MCGERERENDQIYVNVILHFIVVCCIECVVLGFQCQAGSYHDGITVYQPTVTVIKDLTSACVSCPVGTKNKSTLTYYTMCEREIERAGVIYKRY